MQLHIYYHNIYVTKYWRINKCLVVGIVVTVIADSAPISIRNRHRRRRKHRRRRRRRIRIKTKGQCLRRFGNVNISIDNENIAVAVLAILGVLLGGIDSDAVQSMLNKYLPSKTT